MNSKMHRSRVKGFLDVKNGKLVNEEGKEVLLSGWGLGNWLLPEGYMWLSRGSSRFDRPRRIETVLDELAGKEYTAGFWKQFRENYIAEADIKAMAERGYNSVRVPVNYRLFLEDAEKIVWLEEGFGLLDRVLDWCEKYKLYVFIDLHGAPGGQTGSNIDDCIDDMPRLFLDQSNFEKGIALWKKLAERYKDRWIVGGYDLLNEPIRPKRTEEDIDVDYLVPRLVEFYEKAIAVIREVDDRHVISLEGHHWATEPDIFCKKYDEKVILHFHRYGVMPDKSCLMPYVEIAKKWNFPLWLGETGENMTEWFTALYPLAAEMGIGYNVWPWKKMDTHNSPCSVKKPEGWEKIIDYTLGGAHPGYEESRRLLDCYLENMKYENCEYNSRVHASVLRQPGCTIKAVDFDEFPGRGKSYSGIMEEDTPYMYRVGTFMNIVDLEPLREKKSGFDSRWDRLALKMCSGEFADYSLNDVKENSILQMECKILKDSVIKVWQNGQVLQEIKMCSTEEFTKLQEIKLIPSEKAVIRIEILHGDVIFASFITN